MNKARKSMRKALGMDLEEKTDIAQNITDTLAEAKIKGYDVKTEVCP